MRNPGGYRWRKRRNKLYALTNSAGDTEAYIFQNPDSPWFGITGQIVGLNAGAFRMIADKIDKLNRGREGEGR